jgi:YbbR domain-containing protein
VWLAVSLHQPITLKYSIPLCFQEEENRTISGPEEIVTYLTTQRKNAHAYDLLHTIAYIDTTPYPDGTHTIKLHKKNLFLPNHVKLVHLEPSTISLTLQNKETV